MVFLLRMTNNSHEMKVEDMGTFGIAKTEFQNQKQILMKELLVIGNTGDRRREDFPCILKHFLDK